ncbi:MAG: NrfD/PsrC family molybdoenzyme membrane anchor subunit [Nitrospinota bacterium]
MTFSEFSYPNDVHIIWTLMIVTYPFITGLVAGAFLVSALYFVFNKKELEPIHRFALIVSFSFMVCATLPLLLHLGHPERAFNVVIVPNFTSAISGFGFIYGFYFVILTIEIWLAYRIDIIENYRKAKGFKRTLWSLLALGVYDDSAESIKVDNWYIHILSLIGIPAAFTLHGYVGFMFGSVKSNPWWSSPLMPQIFLISAIQSGVAAIILLYLVLGYFGVLERSFECLKSLIFYLWFAVLLVIISEGLEILFLYYEATDAWEVVSKLLEEKLWFSFVILQVGIGTGVSFILLTLMVFFQKFEKTFASMAAIVSCLALFEVWMMRWNVVVGGQEFSKSFVGFRSYEPHFLGKEGILSTIILTALPFIVLYIMSRIFSLRPRPKTTD